MTAAEILALVAIAMRIGNTAVSIYERLQEDGRDAVTPEELAELKAAQGVAETKWEAALKKLREAGE